ncbi:MAG: phosphonate C-P lyase system protein PhnH [Rhodobacteraceae bacterium]|nr:phosphonate C-P lyase system protein PhnH [Paracoccaceae bacterium]
MQQHSLEGGFTDIPKQSAHAFRTLMRAMARPGEIGQLAGAAPPAPLSVAAGIALLTLCDPETPLFLAPSLACPALRDWITFHTGAPFVPPAEAVFAVGLWAELRAQPFSRGVSEYPDRSATLIVEMPSLSESGAVLRGPGIKNIAHLNLPETAVFQANAQAFPLGLDFYFTCEDKIAGLARTTRVS